uniref:PHD finger protein ING n=1 Tax=Cannabis sativa TaxID=3483 RepID=A0A803Q3T6_CANSA
MASSSSLGGAGEDVFNFQIEEGELEAVMAGEGEDEGIDDRWCLVGRFLTNRLIDFDKMQNILASLWQPGMGMFVKQLDNNRFLFQFYHEVDIQRVIDGSPWTYDRTQLIIERLQVGGDPKALALNTLDIWIQIHDVQPCKLFHQRANQVVKPYGEFMKALPQRNHRNVGARWLRTRGWTPPVTGDGGPSGRFEQTNTNMESSGVDFAGIKEKQDFLHGKHDLHNLPANQFGGPWKWGSPTIMKMISWNCRGLGPSRNVQFLKELVAQKRPNVIFLCETLTNKVKVDSMCRSLQFEGSFTVEAHGHSGGVALLWKNKDEVVIDSFSKNHIDGFVTFEGQQSFRFTGLYVHYRANKEQPRPFRFENCWCSHQDCEDVIRSSWNAAGDIRIDQKIATCGQALHAWGKDVSGSFSLQIKECNKRDLLAATIKEGDQNNKFFHAKATARKRNNQITQLKDASGRLRTWEDGLGEVMVEYFNGIFKAGNGTWREVIDSVRPVVREEHNNALLRPIADQEVKDAVFQKHPDKSPGPDGMNPKFFQKYWSIVGNDVIKSVKDFFLSEEMPVGMQNTNIVLIPKKKKPNQMSELRPISLCNVIAKVITKVLANRMKGLLSEVISINQSAFIPGRLITDNIMVSFEILHYLKRKQVGKDGYMALKLDMSKSCDRVDWNFLCAMLTRLGFADKWVRLIYGCLSTVQYNIRVNFEKSTVFYSSNTTHTMRNDICQRLGIIEAGERSKYLGLRSTIGRNKKVIFSYLTDKVQKKIQSWDNKFLSRAGKEVLIKSVVQALPAYTMNVFLIPVGICQEIERSISKFWWRSNTNKGIHWLSWDKLSKHKTTGGMGFRDFNLALLAKQGWRLLTCESSLVGKIFKARYFANGNFLSESLGNNPSYIWRSVLESQALVRAGARRSVGSGSQVNILHDPWLVDDANPYVESRQDCLVGKMVNALMKVGVREWDDEVLKDVLIEKDQEKVWKIPLIDEAESDDWYWRKEATGLGVWNMAECLEAGMILWSIWRVRNEVVWNAKHLSIDEVLLLAKLNFDDWYNAQNQELDDDATIEKMRKDIELNQDNALNLCTEKVLLAQQAYDLIDSHVKRLDEDLTHFAEDLKQEGKIGPDEPAILPPMPLVPKAEKRKHVQYGTPQPKRFDYRERDWDRDRDRDFELMPPPGSHKKDFATPVDAEQPIDPNEPTYCVCHQVSFGDMIACDNENCQGGEWFHYACVGLTPETRFKGKWYCPTCRSQPMF